MRREAAPPADRRRLELELLIFDCDGVLVDSEPLANRVLAAALAEIGLPMSYEEVCRRFVGLSLDSCVEIIEHLRGAPVPADFLERLQRRTFERFRRELRAVPEVEDALRRIRIPVCVASSGDHEKLRLTLGITGLLPYFQGRIFSVSEVERGKPAPDLFLHAARSVGADPRRSAVVEDSLPGVRAALAAGMKVFGYAAGEGGAELRRAGARVFHSMRELPSLLERWSPP